MNIKSATHAKEIIDAASVTINNEWKTEGEKANAAADRRQAQAYLESDNIEGKIKKCAKKLGVNIEIIEYAASFGIHTDEAEKLSAALAGANLEVLRYQSNGSNVNIGKA